MVHQRNSGFRRPTERGSSSATNRAGALLVAALVMSCSTIFLQEDGFRSKLAQGCHTEEACRALVDEASKRVDHCQSNTIGYVRCEDANADLGSATAMLAKVKVSSSAEPSKTNRESLPQAPAAQAKGDEQSRGEMLEEMNQRAAAREAAERQQQVDVQAEVQSGRCTDAHAEQLQRGLDQVVDFWRNEPLQVVTHKIVVLTAAGIGLEMRLVLPGEYHVFAVQPDGRVPQLSVLDGDGYEVKRESQWGGVFPASARSRRLQWSDPSEPMLLKVAGQGCAMIVLVQRLW